ncbi:MAG: hypothetical protein PHY13_00530 [Clostridia bacterium]|nr:hypothetical protein [Clostridia bacterium]
MSEKNKTILIIITIICMVITFSMSIPVSAGTLPITHNLPAINNFDCNATNDKIELIWSSTTQKKATKFSLYLNEVLTEVKVSGNIYSYEYDNYNRVTKSYDSKVIRYEYGNNSNLISENRNGTYIKYIYGVVSNSESIIGFILDDVKYSYRFIEGTKTVEAITTSYGKDIARYCYGKDNKVTIFGLNRFGIWVDKSSDKDFIGSINLIRFNSYYFDEETGYYYDGGYYYDAANHAYIVNNSVKLDEINTLEGFLKYKNITPSKSLTLNEVDQLAEDWKDTLMATSTYGQSISAVSNWYSSLGDEEIIARLIYAENPYANSYADRSAITQLLINRRNSSSFPNTFRNVAIQSSAFSTINPNPFSSSTTYHARNPVKSSSVFIETTYVACVLALTSDTSIVNTLVGKPTNFTNQVYFRALSSFPSSNVCDGASSMEITYDGVNYVPLSNVYVFDTYSSTKTATFIADVVAIKNDPNNPIDVAKYNIFFYHP